MARTLKQLKESVERMIKEQGEDAPVAAFIFTKLDVYVEEEDVNGDIKEFLNRKDTEEVLDNIEDNDWIYEQVFSCIENEIRDLKRNTNT